MRSEILDLRSEISETFIIRPTPSFRRDPVNDLIRIHDVARLAVDAVREIYLQLFAAVAFFHFVNCSRAKTLAWISVLLKAARRTYLRIEDMQV